MAAAFIWNHGGSHFGLRNSADVHEEETEMNSQSYLLRTWREQPGHFPCPNKTKREYVPASQRKGYDPAKIQVLPGPQSQPRKPCVVTVPGVFV